MTKWVVKGLKTGIKTTGYPGIHETAEGVSPGRPGVSGIEGTEDFKSIAESCPADALTSTKDGISLEQRRCIDCFRCSRLAQNRITRDDGYEWADFTAAGKPLGPAFTRSVHIRIVDAGACAACLSEIKLMASPYYNVHRLGLFITPTPRMADVLMVAGPLTEHMRLSLEKTFEAMPTPKVVIAVGTCALSGGVFGPSFAAQGGIGKTMPVDVEIPGCPPPPLAIIHGLLLASGKFRKQKDGGAL
ncbi:MAG: 4Fe-4S ferredoxin [Deltaproteobacteria bacterium]|nr:4Fe-4S ferredoxin [Deltaproteobacteria bacterium]